MLDHRFKTERGNEVRVTVQYNWDRGYQVMISKNNIVIGEAKFYDHLTDPNETDHPKVDVISKNHQKSISDLMSALDEFRKNMGS